jgi:hypothetical protein
MRELIIRMYELLHDPTSPLYEDRVYEPVGLILISTTVLCCAAFYYVLNGFRARFSGTPYWLVALLFNSMINAIAPAVVVHGLGDDQVSSFSADSLLLCGINAGYAIVLFIVVSMTIKWWSAQARKTPF